MKNQKGVSLIALIITIIVIIILAAIVMGSGGNTIGQANYASFAQQFGEYADQVKIDAATVMAENGKDGLSINNAQKFYLTANGGSTIKSGDGAYGFQLPVGYVIPDAIKEALNINLTDNTVVAYLIPNDSKISGYETKGKNINFYGDTNGVEQHFVTSDGTVFTVPGFAEEQENGTIKYYITSQGDFYTTIGTAAADTEVTADKPVLTRSFDKLIGTDADGKTPEASATLKADSFDTADAAIRYVAGSTSASLDTRLTFVDLPGLVKNAD